jgi:hypothetical protein
MRTSTRLKGKIYSACVRSVMVYGRETWSMKVDKTRKDDGEIDGWSDGARQKVKCRIE